jgi:hypothetical protein
MARRAGKADRRRTRQRAVRRTQPAAQAAPPSVAARASPAPTDAPREEPRRSAAPVAASGPSGLGDRARAEYHYVGRDLRDITILTAVMAVGLIGAWFAFSAMGLVSG